MITKRILGRSVSPRVRQPSCTEAAKAAVSRALEVRGKQASVENNSGNTTPQLDPDHWLNLDQAYFKGEPIASMLMGQAIWKGLRPKGTEGSQVVLARGRDADESKKVSFSVDHRVY